MGIDDISRVVEAVKTRLPSLGYKIDEPMKNHTSFKVGGPVRAMCFPRNTGELIELRGLLREYGIEPLIIGNGTNILINDARLDMIAIKTAGLGNMDFDGQCEITAGAGVPLSKLAELAHSYGLSGLEFAYGIPGSAGGAVSMNAGAYGGEMKDVVQRTSVYSMETGMYTVSGNEHDFSYRGSRFSGSSDIVVSTVLRLQKGNKNSIKAKMDELIARRGESQPLDMASAGSTFKRPEEGYAASFIEQAGLKGFTIGGAQVSEKHSGFIVNRGAATFAEIVAVIEYVQESVLKRFGVYLEPEVKIIR